jgi:hypothetical protein
MKQILILMTFLFPQLSFAQSIVRRSGESKIQCRQVFHCSKTITERETPLIVIDGVIMKWDSLAKINPDDILSITILKNPEGQGLYGYQAMNGVIIMTTKKEKTAEFLVQDIVNSHPVPLATFSFLSSNGKMIAAVTADDSGRAVIKNNEWDKIIVSAIGYKNDTIESALSWTGVRSRWICCGCCGIRMVRCTVHTATEEISPAKINLYPNPVARGQQFNIEFTLQQAGKFSARLIDAGGRVVLQKEVIVEDGLQRVTFAAENKWAAGSYFIQLISNEGKSILQKQMVIQ